MFFTDPAELQKKYSRQLNQVNTQFMILLAQLQFLENFSSSFPYVRNLKVVSWKLHLVALLRVNV